jgi:predicted RNA-binding protein YlqC (UPF0109 family)
VQVAALQQKWHGTPYITSGTLYFYDAMARRYVFLLSSEAYDTSHTLLALGNPAHIGRGAPMKELIEEIAKAIVEKPEEVQVRGVEGEHAVVIELRVAKDDIGKVIGKQGKTITAMRTILNATRAQKQKRQVLEVIE